jgi:hypothetical protein
MNETPENLTFAQIENLQKDEPKEFERLARIINTDDGDAQKRRHSLSKKVAGKIICAICLKDPEYFEKQKPRRRSLYGDMCAKAYSAYVLAREGAVWKISEWDYDNNTTEVLECAASVVNKLITLDHPAVADAAKVLRNPRRYAIDELREICERIQQGKETWERVYLTPEQYEAQQLAVRDARRLSCASDSEPASQIGKKVHPSELEATLEMKAASTPDREEARALAIHAATILAGLANNRDENGRRRFTDEEIAAMTRPDSRISGVKEDSLKVVYDPATTKVLEVETKLNETGSIPIQRSFLPQPGIKKFMPAPEPQSSFGPRWQNAERVVLKWLRSLGWKLVDVSGQKAGCDFKGHNPEGEEVFVDVKSITRLNEPFTMTDGEMLLARQKGAAYQVALLRATETQLQLTFICDPAKLNPKQRFREVYWEFAEYGEFRPVLACPLE